MHLSMELTKSINAIYFGISGVVSTWSMWMFVRSSWRKNSTRNFENVQVAWVIEIVSDDLTLHKAWRIYIIRFFLHNNFYIKRWSICLKQLKHFLYIPKNLKLLNLLENFEYVFQKISTTSEDWLSRRSKIDLKPCRTFRIFDTLK